MKHYLRNNSVSVYGLVLDIEYYWTPGTEATNDHPGDDPEVEINTINWTNSAGESQGITDLILALDRAQQGKINILGNNTTTLTYRSIMDDIIESIEKLEQ